MSRGSRLGALLLALAWLTMPRLSHATFVIVNMDGPNEGFNDPTPAVPVGGNPGTTVGQQRLNVFVKAGQIWDSILQSPVTIRVQADVPNGVARFSWAPPARGAFTLHLMRGATEIATSDVAVLT